MKLLSKKTLRTMALTVAALGAGTALVFVGAADLSNDPEDLAVRYADMDGQKVILIEPAGGTAQTDRAQWAFNFPHDIQVSPVLAVKAVTIGAIGLTPSEGAYVPPMAVTEQRVADAKGRAMPVVLTMPVANVLGSETGGEPTAGEDLEITLRPERVLFRHDGSRSRDQSFTDRFNKRVTFDCRKGPAASEGLVQLRAPDAAELAELPAIDLKQWPPFGTRQDCVDRAATAGSAYALYAEDGTPRAFGRCVAFRRDAQEICRFTFWLPQERLITYRFSADSLGSLEEIDRFARSYLMSATVPEASRGIPSL